MRFSTRKSCARGAGIAAVLFAWAAATVAVTTYKQPGFSEAVVFTGLTNPTVVRFLPDGRVARRREERPDQDLPEFSTPTRTRSSRT